MGALTQKWWVYGIVLMLNFIAYGLYTYYLEQRTYDLKERNVAKAIEENSVK